MHQFKGTWDNQSSVGLLVLLLYCGSRGSSSSEVIPYERNPPFPLMLQNSVLMALAFKQWHCVWMDQK